MNSRIARSLIANAVIGAACICTHPTPVLAAAASTTGYHILHKFTVGGDGGWDYLNVDAKAHRLYISRGSHVMVVDSDTGKTIGDIPNTNGVHGIAVVPKLDRGFTSNGRDSSVTEFDLKTLKEVATIKVGDGPDAIIYDPASERVFTMNGRGASTTAIDSKTGTVAGTVQLDGKPEFAQSDGTGHVYVNIEDKSEIQDVDSKALKVVHTWSIAPGESPSGLAIDTKHHRLFSVCDNQKMIVLDTQTGKVIATPVIGDGPDAAGFDPKTGYAFSSNGESGTVTIVREKDPNSFEVVDNIETQTGARTMTVDTSSHKVYLVTAQFTPPAPGATGYARRGTMVPGSFAVLVVGK